MDKSNYLGMTAVQVGSYECNRKIEEVKESWMRRINELNSEICKHKDIMRPHYDAVKKLNNELNTSMLTMKDNIGELIYEYEKKYGQGIHQYIRV